jgi:hypothetical protein
MRDAPVHSMGLEGARDKDNGTIDPDLTAVRISKLGLVDEPRQRGMDDSGLRPDQRAWIGRYGLPRRATGERQRHCKDYSGPEDGPDQQAWMEGT